MSSKSSRHIGKKILYSFVIALCALVILVSVTGAVGAWAVRRPAIETTVAILKVVEGTARTIQQSTGRVDQGLVRLQGVAEEISGASEKIGQNIADKGLVMTLLPEEEEQKLISAADSVKEAFTSIQETISAALELYRSIDRLPFVSLPAPDPEQVQKIQTSIAQVETVVATLRTSIADFRSGVTNKIDQVTGALTSLNSDLERVRNDLKQLNEKLAALEALAIKLQQTIPGVLTALVVILTLFLAFLIYTQVEVILLFVKRWRLLG
jgi:DNA repair ATPase RecN